MVYSFLFLLELQRKSKLWKKVSKLGWIWLKNWNRDSVKSACNVLFSLLKSSSSKTKRNLISCRAKKVLGWIYLKIDSTVSINASGPDSALGEASNLDIKVKKKMKINNLKDWNNGSPWEKELNCRNLWSLSRGSYWGFLIWGFFCKILGTFLGKRGKKSEWIWVFLSFLQSIPFKKENKLFQTHFLHPENIKIYSFIYRL